MKYTEEYLIENPVTSGLTKLLSVLTSPAKVGLGVASTGARAAGVGTIAKMAQDVGLGQRQKEFLLQGSKAGFGGSVRGSDLISKAVIGNLPIQSELLRTINFPSPGGGPTWVRRKR